MKNKIKIILIIVPLLFLTGCYKEYKIEILEDKSVLETGTVKVKNTTLCKRMGEESDGCDIEAELDHLANRYGKKLTNYQVNKLIGKDVDYDSTSIIYTKKYNSITELMTSKILNEYYKDVSVVEDNGKYKINVFNYNSPYSFVEVNLGNYVIVYIKSYYKIEGINSTLYNKKENIYKITFKGDPSNFSFIVNTNEQYKSQDKMSLKDILLVIGAILTSLILVIVVISLYDRKKQNG